MRPSSSEAMLLSTSSRAALASFAADASLSSAAKAARTWPSSSWRSVFSIRATVDSSPAFSLSISWARTLSLQKFGCAASRSISAIRDRFRSRSKMPPERLQARAQLADAFGLVDGHRGLSGSLCYHPSPAEQLLFPRGHFLRLGSAGMLITEQM